MKSAWIGTASRTTACRRCRTPPRAPRPARPTPLARRTRRSPASRRRRSNSPGPRSGRDAGRPRQREPHHPLRMTGDAGDSLPARRWRGSGSAWGSAFTWRWASAWESPRARRAGPLPESAWPQVRAFGSPRAPLWPVAWRGPGRLAARPRHRRRRGGLAGRRPARRRRRTVSGAGARRAGHPVYGFGGRRIEPRVRLARRRAPDRARRVRRRALALPWARRRAPPALDGVNDGGPLGTARERVVGARKRDRSPGRSGS